MSPAWSVSTSWAGSSNDEVGQTRGLNEFGKSVIREMNRLGIMVDVSHVSDQTFWDIINTSTKPIIASHSGCRALANVRRNLDDEMIRAIAKNGGVACVLFYPEFLEAGWDEKKKKVDVEIASLVQRASEEEKGDIAHKKLARDHVRRDEYAKRLPPVSVSHTRRAARDRAPASYERYPLSPLRRPSAPAKRSLHQPFSSFHPIRPRGTLDKRARMQPLRFWQWRGSFRHRDYGERLRVRDSQSGWR